MADATARVAGLLAAEAAAATATVALVEAAAIRTTLAAVASNVADLTALVHHISKQAFVLRTTKAHLVALSAGLAATAATAAGGAVAGDVAGLAAAVAGLGVLGALGAITAYRPVRNCPRKGNTGVVRVCTHSCDPLLRNAKTSC